MAKGRLDSIQVLRGVAAMLVVLFHFRHYINNVYPLKDLGDRLFLFGEAGVDIFFVISGFIIVYASRNKENNTFAEFAIKRFFRLYPLYFVVLTVYLLSSREESFTIVNIIKSYLLIPIDYNGKAPWFGMSTIYSAWTLTYESYFYMVFSLAMLINHKYRAVICSVLILTIIFSLQKHMNGVFTFEALSGENSFHGIHYNFLFVSNPIIIDFVLGMLVAYIYLFYIDKFNGSIHFTFLSILAFTISLIFMLSKATSLVGPLYWGWCSAVIVLSILIISRELNIFYPRLLVYIGEMSYSIYINHVVVKKVVFSYIGPLNLFGGGDGFFILFSLVIITLCISYATYNYIEKPTIKMGHKLSDRIKRNRLFKMEAKQTT